jgi:ferredoxin
MQEFIYFNKDGLDFPLSETIKVTTNLEELQDSSFLVSNSKGVKAEFYAPEIDFYIRNSQDSFAKKIENVQKLYELNAIKFDYAEDVSYTQEVSNKVLLVANPDQSKEFIANVDNEEFDLFKVTADIIKHISGHLGNLSVVIDDDGKDIILRVDQIVWYDAQDIAHTQSGSFDPLETSLEDVLTTIRANIENYEYKKFTTYDSSICQYHERREEICSKCEEVCPTTAIVKVDEQKHLVFSQIDCHGCGGCISVCPSGAVDYAPTNREALFELSKQFKDTIPLVIPEKMALEDLSVDLKENILPFTIEGEKFLHEASFLTLLQESGSSLIFYSDFLSKGSKDAIKILNDIYAKKYNKKAIYIAMDKEELIAALEEVDFVENSRYTFNQVNIKKRETFAFRLKHIVGDDDLGVVATGEHVHYGKIKVNEDTCTLCLSCVGACNVDALIANVHDNSLRLNASVCTSCGYCIASCPEKDCMTIEEDIIELKPTWFTEETLAKDTLFGCVECGKEYTTTKAVEKIAAMMAPLFAHDPVKERTLYCCEDCKPKIMMESYMNNKVLYNKEEGK